MQFGLRERVPFPETYKGFQLLRTHGRVYAIPYFLEAEDLLKYGRLQSHPAVLSAATLNELTALIDDSDLSQYRPELAGHCNGYVLIRHRGAVYGVPQSAGPLDLNLEEDRRREGVIAGANVAEVEARIRAAGRAVPVEFAGWLPIYEFSGNCGTHPQFTHTADPPAGYRFTCSEPPKRLSRWQVWGRLLCKFGGQALRRVGQCVRPLLGVFRGGPGTTLRDRGRVFAALVRLCFALLFRGARLIPVLRFLQSRHYQSQVLLARHRGLVFLTSMPYTYNQDPWLIEIEDPTTLFYPLIQNGGTCGLRLSESPYFPIIKTMLESEQCRGIVTHMKSTARLVSTLFASETVTRKIFYTPLGVKVPARWQRHEDEPEQIDLLFINSWCQVPENFYVRGGLDVLEAFAVLRERYPQLRLTLRTSLPALDDHYHRIIESGWVRVINRFLSPEEMAALHAGSHIFLLPAARVHIVSLLQAMSYGLAVVASDGWGIEEYVTHERNGLIVKGRYGKTSWADERAGVLREDYEPTHTPDPEVVRGIVEAVSRLVEDRELRRRLGHAARRDVETTYNLERWNAGLKEAFDRATAPNADGPASESVLATVVTADSLDSFPRCSRIEGACEEPHAGRR
jgi:glycosyltransferase involved in cell wall biosynthesis